MKKLYRSTRDKKFLGLCGGVAEMLNIDATLLRVLFIVAVIFSSGALILVYILAGMVVPKEPPIYTGYGGGFDQRHYNPYGPGGQGYYNPGPTPGNPGPHGDPYGRPGPTHSDPYGRPGPTPGSAYGRPGPTDWQSQTRHQAPQDPGREQKSSSPLDEMMDDIENKALRKELEELRAKLSKYEKGER
ncbi:PspC domain-containing protein [Paenibacillus sp. 598K]|uniref:PspC domain-containing protein n=1 Tax=Paenibacillus sp. 598K TaxID=1117987 RepID=UPI000FFEF0AC|nr:PspC domain-containing protein [Paenibacillus sp. 598K]